MKTELTQEQKQIKIAEACGWEFTPSGDSNTCGVYPEYWHNEEHDMTAFSVNVLPDYFNDLNAMHEAEKVFDDDTYVFWLRKITGAKECGDEMKIVTATAAQRAEAFGKTLGLW